MRPTTICNELKQIISNSGKFEFLQMVLELDIEQCASENVGPQGSGLRDLTSWRGERNISYEWKSIKKKKKNKNKYYFYNIIRVYFTNTTYIVLYIPSTRHSNSLKSL